MRCNCYGCCDCDFSYSVWPKCAWFVVSFTWFTSCHRSSTGWILCLNWVRSVLFVFWERGNLQRSVTCVWEEGSRQRECDEKHWYVEKKHLSKDSGFWIMSPSTDHVMTLTVQNISNLGKMSVGLSLLVTQHILVGFLNIFYAWIFHFCIERHGTSIELSYVFIID